MIRLFNVFVPTSVIALLVSEMLIIAGSYVAAVYIFPAPEDDPVLFLLTDYGLWRIILVSAVIILGLYFSDLYTRIQVRHRTELFQQLCMVIGAAFISQALFSYARRDWTLPKALMIEGSTIALLLLFVWRILYSTTIGRSMGAQRILFLGRSPMVFQVADHLANHPELGFRPLGYLDEHAVAAEHETPLPLLGKATDVTRVAAEQRPDQIVVGMNERRDRMPALDLLDLRFSGIKIDEIATFYEITFGRVCTREIRPSQLIFTNYLGPRGSMMQIQTLYSRVIALLGLIVSLPVMIAVAIAVRVTSPGPILFRQKRVGLNEKIFTLYKFRSMTQDAEAKTGPVWATANDRRATPIGNRLRRLRLDELPQLFNVLRGDMVIVGPRPERPEFVQSLNAQIPYYRQRHSIMPGITGWAQINYKYGETIDDTMMKLEYDLYYIKHVSIWLDFFIMFHTVKIMLLSRGAQ